MEIKCNFSTVPLEHEKLEIRVFACELDGLDEPSGIAITAASGLRVEIHPTRSSSRSNAQLARTILAWQHRQLELERLLLEASQRLEQLEPLALLTTDLSPSLHPQLYQLSRITRSAGQGNARA